MHFLMETVQSYRNACTNLQSQLIKNQETLINVQKELSECKSEKLESLEKVVKSSVANSVKEEFKSYSSVVSSSQPTAPTLTVQRLWRPSWLVQTVVAEEDRSRNLLVFGLPEGDREELETKVSEIFEEVGQKPKLEAQRIGKKKTDGATTRPVKVCVSSSLIVQQILSNARNLRQSAKFKTVFLSPDRSPQERESRRELIASMRAYRATPAPISWSGKGQKREAGKASSNLVIWELEHLRSRTRNSTSERDKYSAPVGTINDWVFCDICVCVWFWVWVLFNDSAEQLFRLITLYTGLDSLQVASKLMNLE